MTGKMSYLLPTPPSEWDTSIIFMSIQCDQEGKEKECWQIPLHVAVKLGIKLSVTGALGMQGVGPRRHRFPSL